jgi:large subunit ribosomal protein L34
MSKTQGPTYQPSKIKRIRKFGFLKRNESSDGKNVLKRRRAKGRHELTVSNEFGKTKIEKNKRFSRRR